MAPESLPKARFRAALKSASHHQHEAIAFLAHGEFVPAQAHAWTAMSIAVIAALERMAYEDDDG